MHRVTLDEYLAHEIAVGSFPAASYAIGSSRGLEREGALGHSVAVPVRIAANLDTIFDCASITKPLITGTLVLQAVAEGRIALDDEYRGHTFRNLLGHTTGLRAWLPLYAYGDYLLAIEEHGRECGPVERVIYSDLNFVLLWYALRELFGDYVKAARERIFEPLGLPDAQFHPPSSLLPRIAATEWGQRYEQGMCLTRQIVFTGFRDGLMWGETHDGNSHHAGGTCGNAGLFATARDVFRIAQGFSGGQLLPLGIAAEAARPHFADRALGWELPTEGSLATSMLSRRAYGHTGFTGTSVWIDPEADKILVLLTNRVHPCAAPVAMQRIRGEFHRLALAGER